MTMKIFTLSISMLLLSVVAFTQNNPCPDVHTHGYYFVGTVGVNCSAKIQVYATGDVSAQKGLRIQVFQGPGGTGTLLADTCHIVPKSSPSSLYETAIFTAPCSAPISYVISRYTSSNGICGGTTCGLIISGEGGPLPITISSFFTRRNGNFVTLKWTSESEINAKEFVVERNTGNGYVDVATIAALNIETGSSYTFTDNNNSKKVSQYRLRLVDKDAKFKLSETRSVKGTAAVSDFTVFPNPSVGFAKISITDIAEATTVEVVDNSGRIVRTIELKNSNNVEINNLQSGIYLVRLINKVTGDAVTKKLTVNN